MPTGRTYQTYLNPQKMMDPSAEEVHGLSNDFLKDQPLFKEIVADFLEFISDSPLIIHNAEFDISHLNNELELIGKKKIDKENVIDTLEIARNKYPGSSISLDALCKRFRIDNSKRTKHTALIDCELLSKVYINLIDQKEPVFQFQRISDQTKEIKNFEYKYSKKVIKPSDTELSEHKKFLEKNLKKNYY